MHFHLPKPLHGWREFAGEVGIIVVGVLIALGAEQVVETLHWRREVGGAREALGYEIADSVGQGYEREHINNCVEQRLDLLAAIVDKAGETGRLPPLGSPGSTPYRSWMDATWRTTMAGDVASHFGRRELDIYGTIYVFVQNLQQFAPSELTVWSRLDSIAGPGRAIAPAEVQSLRNDIAEARLLNRMTTVAGIRLRQAADTARIRYDQSVVEGYSKSPTSSFLVCKRMDPKPPPHYGAAPLEKSVTNTRTQPLVLPAEH
jgi:hypothetical protein